MSWNMIVLFLSLPPNQAGPVCQPVHLSNDMGRDINFVVDTSKTHSKLLPNHQEHESGQKFDSFVHVGQGLMASLAAIRML